MCLRSIAVAWLLVALVLYQAKYVEEGLHLHPLERLAAAAELQVDLYAVTVEAQVRGDTADLGSGLGALKSLAQHTKDRIARADDTPLHWNLHADANELYEMVRYEGLSASGTYWAVTAYQRGGEIRLALRRETRQLPDDMRRDVLMLRNQLVRGAGIDVDVQEPRLLLSGRSAALGPAPSDLEVEGWLRMAAGSEMRRLYRDGPEIRATLFSPQLAMGSGGRSGMNLSAHVMPEGNQARVTLGTPEMGDIETQIVTSSIHVHNSNISGQTMAEEVR